jgi:hypothetical protein
VPVVGGKVVREVGGLVVDNGGPVWRRLLHGTDAGSAEDIVANGINREAASRFGGGDVFWMTENRDTARIFAQANPANGSPAVVGVDLDAAVLESLVERGVMSFDDANGAWQVLDWEEFNSATTFIRLE